MIKDLTFITGNPNKAKQIAKYLDVEVKHHAVDLDEIQSLSMDEITEHKVKQAFDTLKVPVIVDDVSLSFSGLNGLPGPFIKYFLQSVEGQTICNMAASLDTQSATALVVIGFYDGKKVSLFKGEISGKIAEKPRGENGFGFDVFFIPDGYEITRAEMDEDNYDKTSPRKIALERFKKFLEEYGQS